MCLPCVDVSSQDEITTVFRPRSEQGMSRRQPDRLSTPEVHVTHAATDSSGPHDRGRKGVLLEPVLGEDSTADASRDRADPARCEHPPCCLFLYLFYSNIGSHNVLSRFGNAWKRDYGTGVRVGRAARTRRFLRLYCPLWL